ncbi:hypothetical protein CLOLEP_03924 [[Clostridium] leptum DSM 753]|uniref:Uncharacterized protein n=1 Tax=[Clostridium] leptum DSM 753 TaxID=428125 RepID=A7VZ95_9FIRM|nr:hypothetical protein CLOLEP_03924 [[Clostridium] leptum DSM 753]
MLLALDKTRRSPAFSGLLFTKRGGVFPNEIALVPPRSAGGSLAGIVKIAVKSPLRSMLAAKVFLPGASFGCAIGFLFKKSPKEKLLFGGFSIPRSICLNQNSR